MPDQVCVNICLNGFLRWDQTWKLLQSEGLVSTYHDYSKEALAACKARCEEIQDQEEDDDDEDEIPRRPFPSLGPM